MILEDQVLQASLLTRLAGTTLLLCGVAGTAQARTLAGVTMPDRLTVQGVTLQLNGMGIRSFTLLQIHGYVAGLYVPTPAHSAPALLDSAGPKLLRIQFVHAAGLSRVQGELRDGRARSCAAGCPKQEDEAFAQLFDTAQPVRPGDVTTYLFTAQGVQVLFNNKSMAMIRNADFGRRMLDGMIGAHPPSDALRDGLLGG